MEPISSWDRRLPSHLAKKIRTALRPFLDCKQRYPELANALQEQADRALRKFAYDGDLKWVSLLMWAGADPRSRGLMLGDEHFGRTEEDRAELAATALMEACCQENVDVLKRLKPDPNRDNLTELLNCAAGLSRKEIIKYLLELGAQPNDKANGASTAMDRCLLHLPHESIDALIHRRQVSSWEVRRTMESLGELAKHGAIWQPDDSRQMELYSERTLPGRPRSDSELAGTVRQNEMLLFGDNTVTVADAPYKATS
jgi:hypothetical protein